MAQIIVVSDLPAAVQASEMVSTLVAGANARASRVAPCLAEAAAEDSPTEAQQAALDEARLVLVGAVSRWSEAGSGALQAQTAGPFGVTLDTRQRGGFNLWPTEIEALQAICKTAGSGAFSIDTAPYSATSHAAWCSLAFGATYCSCGADIAGYPIFEAAD